MELIFDTDVEEKITACDLDSIERIMLNFLSNAIKFTIGIPEDKQDIIFDRFRQVDKSLTRNHEGSGIGLSLVKSLVEMHEGDICVQSEYGKGSARILTILSLQVET